MDGLLSGPGAAEAAARLVLAGGVVAFPTDTVYGLAVLPEHEAAVFALKGREAGKPLIAMAASAEDLGDLAEFDAVAARLAARYWPGPLTLVLPAPGGTLGLRVPDHALALEFLRAAGRPLLTTSANRSGEAPALLPVEAARLPGLAGVLDGGRAPGGAASTVAAVEAGAVRVLRAGPVTEAELLAAAG